MLSDPHLEKAFQQATALHEPAFEQFFLVRLYGLRFSYAPGSCTVELMVRPWMHNPRGTLHGGVIAFGLDVSMGHLLNREIGPCATVETKTQFLRPVIDGEVRFTATFLKRGKSLQHLQSTLTDASGALAAFATATWAAAPNSAPQG